MNKVFVRTGNVKKFTGLMSRLLDKSSEVPKMGLI